MPIDLKSNIIYGPVKSRRLRNSLGLNLLPITYKLCSFDCIYCQYGYTNVWTIDAKEYIKDLPTPEQVGTALKSALYKLKERGETLDYITFSGNGEATLHPDFEEIVKVVLDVKNDFYKESHHIPKVTILSNSTMTYKDNVVKALKMLDVIIMKLDAGSSKLLERINHPANPITFDSIIEGLKKLSNLKTPPLIIQSLFIDGEIKNWDDESISDWIKSIGEIKPLEVQIYSLDRPPADSKLKVVSREILENISRKLKEETGIKSKIYF